MITLENLDLVTVVVGPDGGGVIIDPFNRTCDYQDGNGPQPFSAQQEEMIPSVEVIQERMDDLAAQAAQTSAINNLAVALHSALDGLRTFMTLAPAAKPAFYAANFASIRSTMSQYLDIPVADRTDDMIDTYDRVNAIVLQIALSAALTP